MSKPWEKPSFLDESQNDTGAIELPSGLDGMLCFIEQIRSVDEWRRKRWKHDHPGFDTEIDAEIDGRLKRLDDIARTIENFQRMVEGDTDQELVACALIRVGFLLNMAAHSWTLTAAENGVAQEEGRINAKEKTKVSAEEWNERQQRATQAMKANNGDKIKAARALGIKKSSLENWLRGYRR